MREVSFVCWLVDIYMVGGLDLVFLGVAMKLSLVVSLLVTLLFFFFLKVVIY